MTDREFKRLKRADLIEIIYQMQKKEERYQEAISSMRSQLEDRNVRLENVGSIAEAAVALSDVFRAAQDAADLYLSQIQAMHALAEAELEQAREEAERILAEARRRAQEL